ncbi:type I polyketide synthase [Nonomuraea sp. NPDC000554]|uniref:type I polyketide synthase n=1 Tax=Nonomuraea sp. NPDC000554 TaxID=3154259 RepID=UPI003325F722
MHVNHGRDPIAIVGASCRLPGARNLTEFWDVLSHGRDAIGTIPRERFDVVTEHGRRPDVLTGAGGYLDDIAGFDARFFGVSPFEAVRMDPQQRVLLEVTWEALDDAGIPGESLAGSDTGVYTSLLSSGYWDVLRRAGMYDMHAALGAAVNGIFPGRISTLLDLRGPSMGVEAACATSLLAVHVACRALWSGEIGLAIVGGANLQIVPDLYFALADAGVLSSSGRCLFGDVAGDGYVRSEGVVSMVLKPLSRALDDGDRVYATILGSSVTHDGRTGGSLVAPGLEGHETMLRSAYRDAGVSPCDVDYVEAHGPGTRVGDPTELAALDLVLREGRPADRPCLIGSVKSNIGHTEFVAGLAGLLKTALAVRNRTVPATLHVTEPHAVLRAQDPAVQLALCTQDWPSRGTPALAGVSSFGMSGTNIHLVLSEAPRPTPHTVSRLAPDTATRLAPDTATRPAPAAAFPSTLGPLSDAAPVSPVAAGVLPSPSLPLQRRSAHVGGVLGVGGAHGAEKPDAEEAHGAGKPDAKPVYVLPVSARDPQALRELAVAYADRLDAGTDVDDLCFSAGARTSQRDRRLAAIGADAASLAAALRAFGESGRDDGRTLVAGEHRVTRKPRVVFVFPGQGAQWEGMGRDLLARDPAFARRLRACARAVKAELGWSPLDVLLGRRKMSRVDEIQPTLWAMQVALAAAWRERGIEPDLLIGHSMGEIAAAVTAGALSVEDGAAVVCRRSTLLWEPRTSGAMWAVGLGEDDAQEAIGEHAGSVCVGVVNSRHATVLSGDPAALGQVVERLRLRGVFCRQVNVDYASHSPQVEPLRTALLDELPELRPTAGDIPMHSSALDRIVDGGELDAGYWFDNLRLPVRFAAAAQAALADGPAVFVEISPHPLLQSALEDEIEASGVRGAVVPSLQRDEPEAEALAAALARAYVLGCRPGWERMHPDGRYVPLPAYPWQHRRFWPDAGKSVLSVQGVLGGEAPVPEPATGVARLDLASLSETELAGFVAGMAAQVLAVPGHEIGIDVPLTLLGLDSVLATRFRDRMRRDMGVDVPIRDLLGPSTLLDLATGLRSAAAV